MTKLLGTFRALLKNYYQFLIVLFLAIFLRVYRLNELTTFGGDQGMDFLKVREMVLYHKWTLIGLKTSIAPFFQGPLYLYILYPFFLILGLNPIAGPIAAVFVSTATIILLYITVRKYFSLKFALLSSMLFAVSPELIIYGSTPLYQNFLPFFIVLAVYLFLTEKKNIFVGFLMGLSIGLGMELHFLNISLGLALFIYLLIFERHKLDVILAYVAGVLVGLTPTIAFEFRHNFLNTRLFLSYEGARPSVNFLEGILSQWTKGAARFLGGNFTLAGSIILAFMLLFVLAKRRLSRPENKLSRLTFISVAILLLLSLKFSAYGPEYILPVLMLFVVLLPISLIRIFPNKVGMALVALLIVFNLFASAKRLNINHGYNMPEGWTMKKINLAGKIISQDSYGHPNFNVASLIDGGTRAYPLRYSTYLYGAGPEAVENYPMNNFLYVVSDKDKEKLYGAKIWEIASFLPFSIGAEWDLQDGIYLYRLDRTRN